MNVAKLSHHRDQPEAFSLTWFDPRNKQQFPAGKAFYYRRTNDYVLRIDEEPLEKHYTMNSQNQLNDKVFYDVLQVIQTKQGKAIKKEVVGYGVFDPCVDRFIHINYGSKYKTLLLDTGDRRFTCSLA